MPRRSACAGIVLALVIAGCGRAEEIPDDQLGGLVVADKPDATAKIDVEKAVKDPDELGRALAQPHGKVIEALGPHVAKIASSSQLLGAHPLTDSVVLEVGDNGAFHGLYTNNADYGRETIFVDGKLYLRPRYQRWHQRAPESPEEPGELRDKYFEAIYATWDLLAPAVQLTDRGKVQIEGRVGRKIEVAQAPRARALPQETLSQRRWREGRTLDGVTGEIVLDASTGVVLAAKLAGNVAFQKDGQRYSMKVTVDASLSGLGTAVPIVAPAEGEIVATPERLREVDERDFLLQNIAPPIRRNADGTAATPQPSLAGSASGRGSAAAPPPPPPDKPKKKADPEKSQQKSDKPGDDEAQP